MCTCNILIMLAAPIGLPPMWSEVRGGAFSAGLWGHRRTCVYRPL